MERATSVRLNFRVPKKLYDQMMELGQVLGLETPSTVARHFLTLGVQGSVSLANAATNKQATDCMQQMLTLFSAAAASEEPPPEPTKEKRRGKTKEAQ